MPFSVVSYNILADAYINPAWYPSIAPSLLSARRRLPALSQRLQAMQVPILCLQEVEPKALACLENDFRRLSYRFHYLQKRGKPDGCATLIDDKAFAVQSAHEIHFEDGRDDQPDSDHLALALILETVSGILGIVNTHLKWDPPDTPLTRQWGYRQAAELVTRLEPIACDTWILCGDLNAEPGSPVLKVFHRAGLRDAYAAYPNMYTCNPNRRAKRIDYLLHTPDLKSQPAELPEITDQTLLPSPREPSDHLPIMARFRWV